MHGSIIRAIFIALFMVLFSNNCINVEKPDFDKDPFVDLGVEYSSVLYFSKENDVINIFDRIEDDPNDVVKMSYSSSSDYFSFNPITHELKLKNIDGFMENYLKKNREYNVKVGKEVMFDVFFRGGIKKRYTFSVKLKPIVLNYSYNYLGSFSFHQKIPHLTGFELKSELPIGIHYVNNYIDASNERLGSQFSALFLAEDMKNNKNLIMIKWSVKKSNTLRNIRIHHGQDVDLRTLDKSVVRWELLDKHNNFEVKGFYLKTKNEPVILYKAPQAVSISMEFRGYDVNNRPISYRVNVYYSLKRITTVNYNMGEKRNIFPQINITYRNLSFIEIKSGLPNFLNFSTKVGFAEFSLDPHYHFAKQTFYPMAVKIINTSGDFDYGIIYVRVIHPFKTIKLYEGIPLSIGTNWVGTLEPSANLPNNIVFDGNRFELKKYDGTYSHRFKMYAENIVSGEEKVYDLVLIRSQERFNSIEIFAYERNQIDLKNHLWHWARGLTGNILSFNGLDRRKYHLDLGTGILTLTPTKDFEGDYNVVVHTSESGVQKKYVGLMVLKERLIVGIFDIKNTVFDVSGYIPTDIQGIYHYELKNHPDYMSIDNKGRIMIDRTHPKMVTKITKEFFFIGVFNHIDRKYYKINVKVYP